MFLLEPNETPYDLRFSFFRIPVRVHPMFWLFTAILGWNALKEGPLFLVAWIVAVFVSVLIHELGHVLMGQAFGCDGRIVLYSFGGLAVGSNRMSSRSQRILVSFAGPFAGFLFLAVVLCAVWFRDPAAARGQIMLTAFEFGLPRIPGLDNPHDIMHLQQQNPLEVEAVRDLIFINLAWGLMNLLPIWPLDGGQISRDSLESVSPRDGALWAFTVSAAVAAAVAIYCLIGANHEPPWPMGSKYAALMFGLLAFQSFQMLQQVRSQSRWRDDHWR